MELTHLSLFSGIGGIDIAAEWAGFKTVGQVEWAEYQTKVLEKHWPAVERWKDVRDFRADEFIRKTGVQEVTVLSGGFPCQPHSLAGKRLASNDERDMWPEYRRIIGEIKPRWVVAENVRGLLASEDGRFFLGILRDLSDLGYNATWCTYPAAWAGAIHRRERVFTIAYSSSVRWDIMEQGEKIRLSDEFIQIWKEWSPEKDSPLHSIPRSFDNPSSGVIRNDDGISSGVDRIKCIGNAVVPFQIYPIFNAIAHIEKWRR